MTTRIGPAITASYRGAWMSRTIVVIRADSIDRPVYRPGTAGSRCWRRRGEPGAALRVSAARRVGGAGRHDGGLGGVALLGVRAAGGGMVAVRQRRRVAARPPPRRGVVLPAVAVALFVPPE